MHRLTKHLLIGAVAFGLLLPVTTSSVNPVNVTVNAKRYHRSRRHITQWHDFSNRGAREYRYANYANRSLWFRNAQPHQHWVRVKHAVPVYDTTIDHRTYDPIYIGKKWLHRGQIVRGYYPPSMPSGFKITYAKGFHTHSHYQRRHAASWIVHPSGRKSDRGLFNNGWMKAVK